MRAALVRAAVRMMRLPRLAPVREDERYEALAERLLAGYSSAFEEPGLARLDFLRWLAESRDVLFHGSTRGDIEALEPIRLSTDAREFGNRQAVFATDDPAWAMWFAILRRGQGFKSMRNGALRVVGDPPSSRSYFFSLNKGALSKERFGDGFVYVLPRATFELEPPQAGVLDTAQWASFEAVRPLVRVGVRPDDFPFVERVVEHGGREPMLATFLRVRRRAGRTRR